MNWDAIAAVAEVAGAIGVIVTLLYLALQVRQNNALMQSEASIAYAEMRRGSYRALSEDTTMLSIILKTANGEELSPVEALSLEFFNRSVFVNWEWGRARNKDCKRLRISSQRSSALRQAMLMVPCRQP